MSTFYSFYVKSEDLSINSFSSELKIDHVYKVAYVRYSPAAKSFP